MREAVAMWLSADPVVGRKGMRGVTVVLGAELSVSSVSGDVDGLRNEAGDKVRVVHSDEDVFMLQDECVESGRFLFQINGTGNDRTANTHV